MLCQDLQYRALFCAWLSCASLFNPTEMGATCLPLSASHCLWHRWQTCSVTLWLVIFCLLWCSAAFYWMVFLCLSVILEINWILREYSSFIFKAKPRYLEPSKGQGLCLQGNALDWMVTFSHPLTLLLSCLQIVGIQQSPVLLLTHRWFSWLLRLRPWWAGSHPV